MDPGVSKAGEGRTFPITAPLKELLSRRKKDRIEDCALVFHQSGKAIPRRVFHTAWTAAREAAQLPDLIPHDLRRSAVRQMERARVPRQVAMRLVGHRTESIYRRYAIVSEADVMAAGASLDAIPVAGAIVTKSLQNKRRHSASKRGLPKNINKWCRGRGSNPHAPFRTQDFKSCASASSATPACSGIRSLRGLLFARARFVPAFCSYDVIVEAIDAFAELRSAGDGVAAIHAFP